MTSISENASNNSSTVDIILQYIGNISSTLFQLIGLGSVSPLFEQPQVLTDIKASDFASNFFTVFGEFLDWFAFDEFQLKLLKGFLLVLVCNFLFICIAWSFYGQNISEKFMRPGM
jgi:hypothetical protein